MEINGQENIDLELDSTPPRPNDRILLNIKCKEHLIFFSFWLFRNRESVGIGGLLKRQDAHQSHPRSSPRAHQNSSSAPANRDDEE